MIKRMIDKAFNAMGYNITKMKPEPAPERPFKVLSLVVESVLANAIPPQDFYFVQIGANDGIRSDPIQALVKRHGLRGLLVEPVDDYFNALVDNYSECERLSFDNCAVSVEDGTLTMYRASQEAPGGDWVHGIASTSYAHVQQSVAPELIKKLEVPALSIQSLFRKHGVERVNLLQVDTEGFDYQIVRMVLDAGWRPEIINYESVNLSERDRTACKRLLNACEYCYIDVGLDTLAVHKSVSTGA